MAWWETIANYSTRKTDACPLTYENMGYVVDSEWASGLISLPASSNLP